MLALVGDILDMVLDPLALVRLQHPAALVDPLNEVENVLFDPVVGDSM